ncbi:MAG: (d)CMP kinase [Synergistaceae bacterium]|nr:(d)CMP kinase [Synergistaceae bacterium]
MPRKDRAPVIVIDGPAGAGKSTVAREVARRFGLPFLDTGAIYRAITLIMTRDGIPPTDSPELRGKLREFYISFSGVEVFAFGENVTAAIRTPEIDSLVSPYSALPVVRESLLEIQRAQMSRGLVAEGRDMGTVVFPDADVKIFLTASPETRARRRFDERIAKGETADYGEILRQVNERDAIDSTRDIAPLKAAEDAAMLDTTGMSLEDVVSSVIRLAGG